MLEKEKKFLDQTGLEYLWSKINMQDYPNNDTLIAIINAIDEGKMDKTTAIPLIEQAIAGQVPVVKSVDENGKPVEWEAQDFTKIPDTTSARQYLVTNSNGEKVWTNLPATETININLTDATLIMPGVIQYYGALSPAEIIEKSRYVTAINLVFIREIRGHKNGQMGVILDKIKDRGYETFTNANGNLCLRVHFDNYAPIIVDAASETSFYLDPEYVAPEPIIPETTEPNQYLTTNENGEKVWEDKLVPITDDEIDTICGGDLISENILVDTTTGDVYRIYVENGKLSMERADVTSDVTELVFIDGSTDVVYKAYVEDGKLCIMEAE